MIKLIGKLLNKGKEKNEMQSVIEKVEEVKVEPYHQNTPYTTEHVYYVFKDALYNHFITVDKYNERSFSPRYFKGRYKGMEYIINKIDKGYGYEYAILLTDEETETVLAIGGPHHWGVMNDSPTRKFRNQHNVYVHNFYVLQPDTPMADFVLSTIEELDTFNQKAEELKKIEKETEEKYKKEEERRKQEFLENKYKQQLNRA